MRPSWDEYFFQIAKAAATRSTCDRAQVGCVLVKDKQAIATGYNGSIAGMPHCDDVGHLVVGGHCLRAVHSEANAIASAAKRGVSIADSICFVTHLPCWPCFRLLAQAGISKISFLDMKLGGINPEILTEMLSSPVEIFNAKRVSLRHLVEIHEDKIVETTR